MELFSFDAVGEYSVAVEYITDEEEVYYEAAVWRDINSLLDDTKVHFKTFPDGDEAREWGIETAKHLQEQEK